MLPQTSPGRAVRVGSVVIALSLLAACGGSNPSGPSGTGNAPTLTGIAPATGPASGGTSVALSGANFTAGATMTIGGVAATEVSVVSGGSITGKTGPHAAGAADVVVTQGGQSARLVNAFTYVAGAPPVIQSMVAQGTRSKEPAQFADLNESVNVTATVTDADTTAASLQYTWTADLGTMPAPAPRSRGRPRQRRDAHQGHDHPQRQRRGKRGHRYDRHQPARLDEGDWRYRHALPRQLLEDRSPGRHGDEGLHDRLSRDRGERQDVINNRAGFVITSWNVQPPQVTVGFGAGCQTLHGLRQEMAARYSQVRWDSNKVGGGTDSVEGVDRIAAVFLSDRWWLCSSDFDGHHLNGAAFSDGNRAERG